MAKKNKNTNGVKRFENVEYTIAQEIQDVINTFKKCGYSVNVESGAQLCDKIFTIKVTVAKFL